MNVRTLLTTTLAGLTVGTLALVGAPQAIARDRNVSDGRARDSRQVVGDSNAYGGWRNSYDQGRGDDRAQERFRAHKGHDRGRHLGWYKSDEKGRDNCRQNDRDWDRDR